MVRIEKKEDIAKAVFTKVKNNPMMSEFFVKVVLAAIKEAYMNWNQELKEKLFSDDEEEPEHDKDFFAILATLIVEAASDLEK